MEEKEILLQELKLLRAFMKEKKINYRVLSTEMDYSTSHVIKVFNGTCEPHQKFVRAVLRAIQGILQRGLKEFYELIEVNNGQFSNGTNRNPNPDDSLFWSYGKKTF